MIIFLFGQDVYRSHQKLGEIIENYRKIHKSGLNLRYVDGEDFDLEGVKNESQTISMFDEKKLIIFKNALDKLKKEEKALDLAGSHQEHFCFCHGPLIQKEWIER